MSAESLIWSVAPLEGSLGHHVTEWQSLCESACDDHPMLRANFVEGLLRHFGTGKELIAIGRNGAAVRAMLVLQHVGHGVWSLFRPSQTRVGCGIVTDTRSLSGLFSVLPGSARCIDLLSIDPEVCRHVEVATLAQQLHQTTMMSIALNSDFDQFISTRPARLREDLSRFAALAESRSMEVRHVVISEASEMTRGVARHLALDSLGNDESAFFTDQMAQMARAGQAEIHELWIGAVLATSLLLARAKSVIHVLREASDRSLAKLGPSSTLMRRLLDDCHSRSGGVPVEIHADTTPETVDWATQRRPIANIRLFRTAIVESSMAIGLALRQVFHRSQAASGGASTLIAAERPAEAGSLDNNLARLGVQSSSLWFDLLHREVFAASPDVTVIGLTHNGQSVASLPVLADRSTGTTSSLSNYYTALYAPYIAPWLKSEDLFPVIEAARKRWPRAHRWTFGPMDPYSPEFMLLRGALLHAGMGTFSYFRFANWQLPCAGMSWAEFIKTRRGGLRSTVNRMGRKFAAQGGRLEVITGGAQLGAGIAAYEKVYASSWKQAEPYPGFVRELMRMCAAHGWLRLGIAWLGDVPIAAQCWTVCQGRTEIVKVAYDEQYKELSIGTILTAELMRYVLDEDKVHVVDFLIGDDPYKRDWMSERHERWALVAYEPTRLRGWIGLGRETAGRVVKSFRQDTKVEVQS